MIPTTALQTGLITVVGSHPHAILRREIIDVVAELVVLAGRHVPASLSAAVEGRLIHLITTRVKTVYRSGAQISS